MGDLVICQVFFLESLCKKERLLKGQAKTFTRYRIDRT